MNNNYKFTGPLAIRCDDGRSIVIAAEYLCGHGNFCVFCHVFLVRKARESCAWNGGGNGEWNLTKEFSRDSRDMILIVMARLSLMRLGGAGY